MTDLRKAAEMALETLVKQHDWMVANDGMFQIPSRKAIETLRQALAQPEQEPVAWVLHRELFWPSEYEVISEAGDNAIPLYTAPPKREWVGLTDEEIMDRWPCETRIEFARSIEAELKEKNA